MTVDAASCWPDEPDRTFETDYDEFDSDLDDLVDEEELAVEFAIDQRRSRLACVYTKGLWPFGIPELCARPPEGFSRGGDLDWGGLAFFLASGLIYLGHVLMAVDHFDIPPYHGEFDGKPVKMWLGRQEPPDDPLAILLGEEVDTVMWVDCSLWHPSLFGDS
jgi:hypothetical protein